MIPPAISSSARKGSRSACVIAGAMISLYTTSKSTSLPLTSGFLPKGIRTKHKSRGMIHLHGRSAQSDVAVPILQTAFKGPNLKEWAKLHHIDSTMPHTSVTNVLIYLNALNASTGSPAPRYNRCDWSRRGGVQTKDCL